MLSVDDYIAIQQLYVRYSFAIDLGDVESWIATWTDDCSLVTHAGDVWEGRDRLRAAAEGQIGNPKERGFHWTTNPVIEPTEYGATGKCYLLHVFASEEKLTYSGIPQGELRYALYYKDELVKQDGRWLFRRRTANII
jgi:hypothetical protein